MARIRSLEMMVALGCLMCGTDHKREVEGASDVEAPGLTFELDETLQGMRVEISEPLGLAAPTLGTNAPASEGHTIEVLGPAATEALVARLPSLEATAGDRRAFAKREDSMPPPKTGEVVALPFPPPAKPDVPDVDPGQLTVQRWSPEGDVPLAAQVSVTFSQPMVAVTSHDDASAQVPVELTPQPEGSWRGVGTRTVLFDPDPRMPMATDYTVRVAEGTTSARGVSLASSHTFTFSTPPPVVMTAYPSSYQPQPLQPDVFLVFDQAIDAQEMARHVRLSAVGGEHAPKLTFKDPASTAEDHPYRAAIDAAEPGRSVLLEVAETLQPGTTYQVEVAPGAPSAEGPKRTVSAQQHTFKTYDPLKVSYVNCRQGLDGCLPDAPLWVVFNNALEEKGFDATSLKVDPAIDDLRIDVTGSTLTLYGRTVPETTYKVTLPASLEDAFGQRLSKEDVRTFKIGHRNPTFEGPTKQIVTLDPAAPPALSIFTVNHEKYRLRVYRVTPEDFAGVAEWMQRSRFDGRAEGLPVGEGLVDQTFSIESYVPDTMIETPIDLAPWLNDDGYGHLFVWVEPVPQAAKRWARVDVMAWVQSTDIGLTAFVDRKVHAWATSLREGERIEGVTFSLLGRDETVQSDAEGLATLKPYGLEPGPQALLARRGNDLAMLPAAQSWWNMASRWTKSEPGEVLRWMVFDDRQMYRPGEQARVKGWLRAFDTGPGGMLGEGPEGLTVTWKLRDSRGNEIGTGEATTNASGGFDFRVDIPPTPNLGWATVELIASGKASGQTFWQSHRHTFQIQEFRRPEFEVKTTVDPRPYVLGEHAFFKTEASYYAGGALPDAPVSWRVNWRRTSYTPPNQSDYRFGRWTPWWFWGGDTQPSDASESFSGVTDSRGSHTIRTNFVAIHPPYPMSLTAEATVQDVNRQRWSSRQTVMVHPSSVYVGVKPDKGFYEEGDDVVVDVVTTDIDGEPVTGVDVVLTLGRLVWQVEKGRWQQVELEPSRCEETTTDGAARCTFTLAHGGNHRLTAKVIDAQGRPNQTQFDVWVTGGNDKRAPQRDVTQERVVLVPDAEQYQPGDTAKVLVQAPFFPAEGVMQVQRSGIMSSRTFSMDAATTVLEVPIDAQSVPNVTVQVHLVGSAVRRNDEGEPMPDKARRVAFGVGALDLKVPPLDKTLSVTASPAQAALAPGGSTRVQVEVMSAAGFPVEAEVALMVVDEAVLALSDYQLPDPIAVFYEPQDGGVSTYHSRAQVVLSRPEAAEEEPPPPPAEPEEDRFDMERSEAGGGAPPARRSSKKRTRRAVRASRSAVGSGAPAAAAPAKMVTVREDFAALALFAPHVQTDATGRAEVSLDLPDNLTRYRIMAVAVAKDQFGASEGVVTARKPLMLRPSPPRFLNFGDRLELPLVVQNQTDAEMVVDVGLRASNAAVLDDLSQDVDLSRTTAGRRVTVPPNDRAEVRFPLAADMAGRARFQAIVATSEADDAATFSFPVWTPATGEAFATYGELDGPATVQPVAAPGDVWPQFGGLEITTSSTAVAALTDAVLYLANYPYDCSEQIASRVMAVAALTDVLSAFEAEQLPRPDELQAAVARDLDRLVARQQGNGGWGYWGKTAPEPFLTVHVAHALVLADARGEYKVNANTLQRAERYLRYIESHIPSWYSPRARWSIRAYAVSVLHKRGVDQRSRIDALLKEAGVEKLPLEALGWLLPAMQHEGRTDDVAAVLRHLGNRVSETAGSAQFTSGYADRSDYVLLHGSRRTDGVLLDALIQVAPDNSVIPKVVRGLLGHRTRGRWSTTQDNAFVLLSLDRYFRVFESETPDFVARVWLGDDYAGDHAFRGRTTERARIDVPMSFLADPPGARDLTVAKDGPGRLYYRIGMRYAPKSLMLEPADHGFEVIRTYEAVDDPADVRRDEDGTWHVRAGARVRVRLSMVAVSRRTHVALVDPLPAGLEAMNPELAVTGAIPEDPSASASRYWWWRNTWYQHQNMRDERVEAFTTLLHAGVHEYSYVAVATTPGEFVVPPAKAEEMYHPETFGRGGTHRMIIE